jgi:hypothetical protein
VLSAISDEKLEKKTDIHFYLEQRHIMKNLEELAKFIKAS